MNCDLTPNPLYQGSAVNEPVDTPHPPLPLTWRAVFLNLTVAAIMLLLFGALTLSLIYAIDNDPAYRVGREAHYD